MPQFYDRSIKVRGFIKSKDWIGWTDGISIITGVDIPFIVLHANVYHPIRAVDVAFELQRNYQKYGKEPEVTLIKTPMASAVVNTEGEIMAYTRLDYYEIMFDFGLHRMHRITFGDRDKIHIYDIDNRFVGFFGIYSHRIWKDMFGVRIPYDKLYEDFFER